MDDDNRLFFKAPTERDTRALELVQARPGITVAQLSDELGVSAARARKIVLTLRTRLRIEAAPLLPGVDLQPRVSSRSLPSDVRRARADAQEADRTMEAVVAARVTGHVAAYGMAVDVVEALHQRIADETDCDLTADTRWAAIWQLAGRSIGYARAVIVLANAGVGDEALPTARAMHECVRLLDVVTYNDDRQLLARWLVDDDGSYVRAGDARNAIESNEEKLAEMMIVAGEQRIPNTRHLSDELYHRMSVVTHNRRQATQPAVAGPLRSMARGDRRPLEHAAAVLSLGTIVEEAVTLTGGALAVFLGSRRDDWIKGTLRTTLATFEAVRRQQPLEPSVLMWNG